MNRVLVIVGSSIATAIGGAFVGRKTANVTISDVKAVPKQAAEKFSNGMKSTGKSVLGKVSKLAFWKKSKSKDDKDYKALYQDVSEKHAKLEDDFTESVKLLEISENDKKETQVKYEQEIEKNRAFQNTLEQRDEELKKTSGELKTASAEKTKLEKELKAANSKLEKLEPKDDTEK